VQHAVCVCVSIIVSWDDGICAPCGVIAVDVIKYAEDAEVEHHYAQEHDDLVPVEHVLVFASLQNFTHLLACWVYVCFCRCSIYTFPNKSTMRHDFFIVHTTLLWGMGGCLQGNTVVATASTCVPLTCSRPSRSSTRRILEHAGFCHSGAAQENVLDKCPIHWHSHRPPPVQSAQRYDFSGSVQRHVSQADMQRHAYHVQGRVHVCESVHVCRHPARHHVRDRRRLHRDSANVRHTSAALRVGPENEQARVREPRGLACHA